MDVNLGHTSTKCPHLFEVILSSFQLGIAFWGWKTQETQTLPTRQWQTKVICFWIKPQIFRLAPSIAHFLECRAQLITVLCSYTEYGFDILIWWRITQIHFHSWSQESFYPHSWSNECFEDCRSILSRFLKSCMYAYVF